MSKLLQLLFIVYIAVIFSKTEATDPIQDDTEPLLSLIFDPNSEDLNISDDDDDDADDDDDNIQNNGYYCPSTGIRYRDCNGNLQKMINAANKFHMNLVNLQLNSDLNVIVGAPLNTFFMICVYALYTYGTTLAKLKKFCGVNSKQQIRCALAEIRLFTENQPRGIEYRDGSVYVTDLDNIFTRPFKQDVANYMGGRALNLDLNIILAELLGIGAKVSANIALQTNGRIVDAITNETIFKVDDTASKVIFASGVFLQAKLETGLKTNNLTLKTYVDLDGESYTVPYLTSAAFMDYAYLAEINAEVLAIPLVKNHLKIYVFLPKVRTFDNLLDLSELLQTPGILGSIIPRLRRTCVEINMPLSKGVSATVDIGELLRAEVNLGDLFSPATALVENGFGVKINEYVSDIIQKVVIKTDLTGAKPYQFSNVCRPKGPGTRRFLWDYPGIIAYENCGLLRLIRIGVTL